MSFPLSELAGPNWQSLIDQLYSKLKVEMQGADGFARRAKVAREAQRKSDIRTAVSKFRGMNDLTQLDESINQLADTFLDINNGYSKELYYDHIPALGDADLNTDKHEIQRISSFLADLNSPEVAKNRVRALVARVINESLSQANKSNAGEAGENLVRAILSSAGLEKEKHYREQYKSKSGSDTDFVFPCVPDRQDQKVELFMAVQMSSNDRARLTASELKIGGKPFVFTGNGLRASKKKLKDIGAQIIESQKANKVNLVCYGPELVSEIERLKKAEKSTKNDAKKKELRDRRDYFENYTWTIADFADHLKKRFL
ncbi:type II restriction endonuclease [Ruegeria arenilitoris]|uniref:type II restriction endonuclease n=1 Tax=Ruegeria arenilitoris TaxID=1173585 RepID=UPI00147BF319|nr:type II restriction endonuclease [Ruegeria arenilitoris]